MTEPLTPCPPYRCVRSQDAVGVDLVESVCAGYNATVFAYGQTGSGKTHTMEGVPDPPAEKGLIPRCFEGVFAKMDAAPKDVKTVVRCSYLEVYKEEIRDLLSKGTYSLGDQPMLARLPAPSKDRSPRRVAPRAVAPPAPQHSNARPPPPRRLQGEARAEGVAGLGGVCARSELDPGVEHGDNRPTDAEGQEEP